MALIARGIPSDNSNYAPQVDNTQLVADLQKAYVAGTNKGG